MADRPVIGREVHVSNCATSGSTPLIPTPSSPIVTHFGRDCDHDCGGDGRGLIMPPNTPTFAHTMMFSSSTPPPNEELSLLPLQQYMQNNWPAEGLPDLIISGVNHGSNDGLNAVYSGTVAAALEGALQGIPSLAVSIDLPTYDKPVLESEIPFAEAVEYILPLIDLCIRERMPRLHILAVNLPYIETGKPYTPKGFLLTQQTHTTLNPIFKEGQQLPEQVGEEVALTIDKSQFNIISVPSQSDTAAILNSWVSVCPLRADYGALCLSLIHI